MDINYSLLSRSATGYTLVSLRSATKREVIFGANRIAASRDVSVKIYHRFLPRSDDPASSTSRLYDTIKTDMLAKLRGVFVSCSITEFQKWLLSNRSGKTNSYGAVVARGGEMIQVRIDSGFCTTKKVSDSVKVLSSEVSSTRENGATWEVEILKILISSIYYERL